MISRQHWTDFGCAHKGFQQSSWSDWEGKVVQIRTFPAGKFTHLLKMLEAYITEPEIIQADRELKRLQ